MFTGLVEKLGLVKALKRSGPHELHLEIEAPAPWRPALALGESVAVNGACLTVAGLIGPRRFAAYASEETARQTTLGGLAPGDRLNLERALPLGGRLGGHLVSGHVDGLGLVRARSAAGASLKFTVGYPPGLAPGLIPKGSVAVDGVSLTVNEVGPDYFTFNLIPHSAAQTTLGFKKAGDYVNLETDLIGKYINRRLDLLAGRGEASALGRNSGLSGEFLARHGFL